MNILYIGIAQTSNPAIAIFSKSLLRNLHLSHHKVCIYGDSLFCEYFENPEVLSPDNIATREWDIVIIQNSLCLSLYSRIMRSLRKTPVIFVSCTDDITGYIAPFDNLYAVLSVAGADLVHWNIPAELCQSLKIPVNVSGNYYRYDERPECYELVYFPVQNISSRIDTKILSLTNYFDCRLTIIGEKYRILKPAMNSRVRIISEKQSVAAFKKAHLVMASGYQAVQAVALCKPCVVVGDHGLGGKITTGNYELFKKYGFRGRAGAACDEYIPLDLLQAEIQWALVTPCENEMKNLHDLVLADGYSYNYFHRIITQTIDQVVKLHMHLHDKNLHKTLKPCLSGTFNIRKINNKNIITCGQITFNEVDDDILALLRQCDGAQTIEEIVIKNGYDRNNIHTFAGSIVELWKKKLVVFSPI